MDMKLFIAGMPKAELHIHIEGVLEPEMKFEMAQRNRLSLPYDTVEDVIAGYDFDDLSTFLVARYEGDRVLVTEQDFHDLTMAYFTKGHEENLIYAEIFFDPQAHTSRGVEFGTVIEGIKRACDDAVAAFGIDSQLIMCFLRDMSAESAAEALHQAEPYRDWIVGVGLDSDERGNPPVKFKDVYSDAASQGYRLTMHCDVDQENSVGHIWQALNEIGVERIDHGVNSLEDDALVREIVDREIGLTVCPVSNVFVVQDSRSGDLKTMLDRGMLATVGSDDPAYFRGYMNENLEIAQRDGNLTAEETARLMRNGFAMSWAPADAKAEYIKRLDDYVAAASS
jgi:adenosine deaminase